jgi:hypothetical protein
MEDHEPANPTDLEQKTTAHSSDPQTGPNAKPGEDAANEKTEPTTDAPVKKVALCSICEKVEAKYKCPRCYLP